LIADVIDRGIIAISSREVLLDLEFLDVHQVAVLR